MKAVSVDIEEAYGVVFILVASYAICRSIQHGVSSNMVR